MTSLEPARLPGWRAHRRQAEGRLIRRAVARGNSVDYSAASSLGDRWVKIASRYAVTETLYRDERKTVCRAVRAADQRHVILKALDPRRCRPRSLERLRHEYEIGCTLDARAIVRPLAFETYHGMPALVLEDFRGQPLDRLGAPLPIETFL